MDFAHHLPTWDAVKSRHTDALLRQSACALIEAHDEWQASDRRYLSEAPMALLYPTTPIALPTAPTEVIATPELLRHSCLRFLHLQTQLPDHFRR